ncbi:MAG: PilZ domain-containing protein [bacterium]|nr:PilZ domain-containing protein [bacterium]
MERRQHPRYEVLPSQKLNATVVLEGSSLLDNGSFSVMELPASPQDLSLKGIGLALTFPMNFSPPTFKECQLLLRKGAGREKEIELTAHLAHFDPEKGRMGLSFEAMTTKQSKFIADLLKEPGPLV